MKSLQDILDGSLDDVNFPDDIENVGYLEMKEDQSKLKSMTDDISFEDTVDKNSKNQDSDELFDHDIKNKEIKIENPEELDPLANQSMPKPPFLKLCIAHEKDKPFKCQICHQGFTQNRNKMRHILNVHEKKKSIKCNMCDRTFFDKCLYKLHITKSHRGNTTTNTEQEFDFLKNVVKQEMDIKMLEDVTKCHLKDVKYQNILVHEDKKCNESYPHSDTLKQHIEANPDRKKSNTCTICKKTYSQKTHLNSHILKVHEGKYPLNCEKCDTKFSSLIKLKEHTQEVHVGKKLFKCDICIKTFTQKSKRDNHISKFHEGNQLFKCDTCDESFSNYKDLKQHKTVHDENKPFPCSHCDKNFSTKQSLESHTYQFHRQTFHTLDEKNAYYFCKICDKMVVKKSHKKDYHNEKNGNLKCPKCEKVSHNFDAG